MSFLSAVDRVLDSQEQATLKDQRLWWMSIKSKKWQMTMLYKKQAFPNTGKPSEPGLVSFLQMGVWREDKHLKNGKEPPQNGCWS